MTVGIEKLRARLEKAEAAKKKAVRQSQLLTTKLGKQERREDTRRKIIDGAHMQTEALNNPVVAMLLQKLRDENLFRDDDRALFGLRFLSDEQKRLRDIAPTASRPRRSAKTQHGEVAALAEDVAKVMAGSVDHKRESEAA